VLPSAAQYAARGVPAATGSSHTRLATAESPTFLTYATTV